MSSADDENLKEKVEKNNPFLKQSNDDNVSLISVSVASENSNRLEQIESLEHPWALLVLELVETLQIIYSIIYMAAGSSISNEMHKSSSMAAFVVIRVGLFVHVAVGIAAYIMLFVYAESFMSCVRSWILGGYFLVFQRTAFIVFINILRNNDGKNDSFSRDLETIILLDIAAILTRLLVIFYVHYLVTRERKYFINNLQERNNDVRESTI